MATRFEGVLSDSASLLEPPKPVDEAGAFPHRVFSNALATLETIMKGYVMPEDRRVDSSHFRSS